MWRRPPNGFPICAKLTELRFQKEFLKSAIERPDGLLFIDPRIALEAFQRCVKCKAQSLRQLCLPATRWTLDQDRLFQLASNVDLGDGDFINNVFGLTGQSWES